ncbi:hypothetical protein J4470_01880 [Candidatus Woesearchaeota archaeon]|nr:hypothetical protein [Candidatus Woesearchaeota archaeon]
MPRWRRKRKFDPAKNRKLDEFLIKLKIEAVKKDEILEFVQKLAFEKVKEASVKNKAKPILRLKT